MPVNNAYHIKDEHANYIIHAKQHRADNEEIDMIEYSKNFFQQFVSVLNKALESEIVAQL